MVLAGCSADAPHVWPRSIGVRSALPLFWTAGAPADMLGKEDQRAPVVRLLAERHRLQPVDMISSAGLRGTELLIIAQPNLMQPQELVDLDQWVRGGGRAILFADPDLRWPSPLPMGDPRRPPAVTLLDPLLTHWGLTLESGAEDGLLETGYGEVRTLGRGRWAAAASVCTVDARALIADCRLGKGRAILVADADLLDLESQGPDNGQAIAALVEAPLNSPADSPKP